VSQYGRGYKQWCKHSAFGYLVGVDYSRLGAVHLHAVVDGWVDFHEVHALWGKHFGFAWTKGIDSREDERVALAHVVKYALKGSDLVQFWFRRRPAPAVSGQRRPVVPVKAAGFGARKG